MQYCSDNVTLSNFYSCPCFSKAVFNARMDPNAHKVKVAGGMIVNPLVNLIASLDYFCLCRSCQDPGVCHQSHAIDFENGYAEFLPPSSIRFPLASVLN